MPLLIAALGPTERVASTREASVLSPGRARFESMPGQCYPGFICVVYESGFESRQGQDFSVFHSVQTGSEAHPASYPTGTVDSFPGGRAART
jgi:hypothetical protein